VVWAAGQELVVAFFPGRGFLHGAFSPCRPLCLHVAVGRQEHSEEKTGDKDSGNPYQKLTQIEPIRNINTIRTIFEMSGSAAILADLQMILRDLMQNTKINESSRLAETTAATLAHMVSATIPPLFWIFAALFCAAWGAGRYAMAKGGDGLTFAMSSAMFAAMWGAAGSLHFPRLVTSLNPGNSITAVNGASGPATLKAMLVIAVIGMPLVLLYTFFAYRVFKGKVSA